MLRCDTRQITIFAVAMIIMAFSQGQSWAEADSAVYLCRTERILLAPGWSAPATLYPLGRIDARQVTGLLDIGIRAYTGKSDPLDNPWREIATPQDKVAIQVDLRTPPVSRETINAIIDGLVNSGVSPDNIIVFTGDEAELFAAGISVMPIGRGIRTMGSESEGYRKGISRIVLDYCTVIINVARLKADRELGMRGCIANCLSVVPYVERVRLLSQPSELPSAAAHAIMRQKTKLHVLEAYQPLLDDISDQPPTTWEYRGLLLSSDPVALDLTGLRILAAKQAQTREKQGAAGVPAQKALEYLKPAASRKYRLGQADPEQIQVHLQGTEKDLLIDTLPTSPD